MLDLILLALGVYFFPSIVAVVRRAPDLGAVIVLNLFFGWSFFGWVVSLAMAART